MPFYEYRCEQCGYELEALQKVSDAPLADCPACGKPALKKLISVVGFRLKGSGWYETDFKRAGKKNLHDAGGDKAAGKGGDGGTSASGEKKAEPAKKADKPSPSTGS